MQPGDKVRADGVIATVLCDVDAGEYCAEFPAAQWEAVLKTGLLLTTEDAGLVHYPDASEVTIITR